MSSGHPAPTKSQQALNVYRKKPLAFILPIFAAVALFLYWLLVWQFQESTDNAYVKSNLTALSPQIDGFIQTIYLDEGQPVKKGQVVIKIDDAKYKADLIVAQEQLSQAQASLQEIDNQLQARQLDIPKSQTQLNTAQSELSRTKNTYNRSQDLAGKKYLSRQDFDKAQADFVKAKNAYSTNVIDVKQANLDLQQMQIQRLNALAKINECAAKVRLAEINLDNTVIKAPANGIMGQRAHNLGEYVLPGIILIYLIPLDDIWIIANFKETQVQNMHPNQKVSIKVDAFKGITFDGTVEALLPAAGSEFSLLPADNATGNFTKIVQRIPVKIRIYNPQRIRIVPGMSVDVTVYTKSDNPQSDRDQLHRPQPH